MSTDDKWVVGIVIAALALYYPSVIGLYSIAATLHGRDKLPHRVWRASTLLFGIAMALPVAALGGFAMFSRVAPAILLLVVAISGVGTVLVWQRRRMGAIWWYSWPPLVMVATLALVAISVPRTRDPVVVILAATTPLFAWYLLRNRLRLSLTASIRALTGVGRRFARAPQPAAPWTYSFIEHLSDHDTMIRSGQGSVVMKVRNAKSLTVLGQAIFEHPPANDDTIIQFSVAATGMRVDKLRLEGSYGILEGFEDEDGQLKESEFPTKSGNTVRFQIRVNGRSILSDDRDDFGWTAIECREPLIPEIGRLLVELRTNSMGNPGWNWAAWGDLMLAEWK